MYRTRTTCFYCGKSRLVNSHTPIVRYFKCPNCEAENRFDERGEIEDFAPESPPERENIRYGYRRGSPKNPHTRTESIPVCCRDCLRNQALIVQNLAEYLPDESHPDYDNYVANLENYRRQTQERYPPICADCAPKVQERIKSANYKAKTAGLAKLLETTAHMLESKAIRPRAVWGLGLWVKVLLWICWGVLYFGSIFLLLFWHLSGFIYGTNMESSGQLSLNDWRMCFQQTTQNFVLSPSCYAVSTDWVKTLYPWVLVLLPWDYIWLSVKRTPGAYVVSKEEFYKSQGIVAFCLCIDRFMLGRIRDEKDLKMFHVIVLVFEFMIIWFAMTATKVKWPNALDLKEQPLAMPPSHSGISPMKPLELPPSPEPPRPAPLPANRSFGFVPGKSSNVQTRSQSYMANGSAPASFSSSFGNSFGGLDPSPFQSTSTSQTSIQPESSKTSTIWGSQPQSSYATARQTSYDPDAMDVDMEPPSSQITNFGLSGPSFEGHRYGTTTPQDTPVRQPVHRRTYSNSSDEGANDLSPIKTRKMIGGSGSSHSYAPMAPGNLNANLFADKTGLEGLFEAAARLEDPIPTMSTKAMVKLFGAFVVNFFRLLVLCVAITVQMEFIGWPSALGMCVAAITGPCWRIFGYYQLLQNGRPVKVMLNRHPRLLLSIVELVFASGHILFSLAIMAWMKLSPQPPVVVAEVMHSTAEEPVFVPISELFSVSTLANALDPTSVLSSSSTPSPTASSSSLGGSVSPLLITQATLNIFATKIFFVVLLVHQAFELVLTLVRRNMQPSQVDSKGATINRPRRTSRDFGISHAVNAQPIGRAPSPLSSFGPHGGQRPRTPVADPFGGLSLGSSSGPGAMAVRQQKSPDRPTSGHGRPYFGMSTAGVKVPPPGSGFGEGMTLRDRGVAANKNRKTGW